MERYTQSMYKIEELRLGQTEVIYIYIYIYIYGCATHISYKKN